jgi:AraC-like DNA-binding protein
LYQYIVIDLNKSPGIVVEDGCREFMFVKQDNVWLKIHGRAPIKVPRAFSVGEIKSPFKYQCSGKINYFAVKLQPWVGRHFFPSDVINDLIDLTRVYGSKIELLRSEIFDSGSFEKMVQRVETFFSNIEMPNPDSYKLAMEICRKIYLSKGMISVRDLVSEFSESRQKINQDFLYHTKYSIKEFAVFVKIREAIKFKQENPSISLTELAHQFEYFDQSHFNRDIKRVTGVTPTFLFSNKNFIKEQLKKA